MKSDTLRFLLLLMTMMLIGCERPPQNSKPTSGTQAKSSKALSVTFDNDHYGQGGLLLTDFKSLDEFNEVVMVEYAQDLYGPSWAKNHKPEVRLTYTKGGRVIVSSLKSGISQEDFVKVRNGSFWKKIWLGLKCPFALTHRADLMSIEHLGRRRPPLFGKGDAAFYDLAESMVAHIYDQDLIDMSCEDLSEKGYLNTFNHITAQAFMTSIFSEKVADFVADVHELYNMPALITGEFTTAQLSDFENGPVDNYVDMINNEFGQEIGKNLRNKYKLSRKTVWSPALLANYLNDILSYNSWSFQIGFRPFLPGDEMIIHFANKMNMVIADR